MMEAKYIIQCPVCLDEFAASKTPSGWMCLNCFDVFEQDGNLTVIDIELMESYRREFKGAKIAGFIPDPEFAGDREQMKREKW